MLKRKFCDTPIVQKQNLTSILTECEFLVWHLSPFLSLWCILHLRTCCKRTNLIWTPKAAKSRKAWIMATKTRVFSYSSLFPHIEDVLVQDFYNGFVLPPRLKVLQVKMSKFHKYEFLTNFKLPDSLIELHINDWCPSYVAASLLHQKLPFGLQALCLTDSSYIANFELFGIFPASLLVLKLSHNFNCPFGVGVLPPNLIYLKTGINFNQLIPIGGLPSSLQKLKLGECYNQPFIVGSLPSSLSKLSLPQRYAQKLDPQCLPNSLTHLKIACDYEMEVGLFPTSLKVLQLYYYATYRIAQGVFPINLQHLHLHILNADIMLIFARKTFPVMLQSFSLNMRQFTITVYNSIFLMCVLPQNLKFLKINASAESVLSGYEPPPASLEVLVLENITVQNSMKSKLKGSGYRLQNSGTQLLYWKGSCEHKYTAKIYWKK